MKTILHIVRKEFIQLRRDPNMLRMSIFAPIFQLLILGYAANLDVRDIPTVVCDLDRTETSREFLSSFANSGYFALESYADRIEEVDQYIDKGKASIAIVIPTGFGDKVAGKRPAQLQIIADGAETNSATIGLNYATMIVAKYSSSIILQTFERLKTLGLRPARVNPEVRVWYNPALKSRNFMIPSVLGLLLMVMTTIMTSLGLVKEKEMGTLEQLIVTPIKPFQLIIGKLTPFIILGIVDIILVILLATFWFNIPVKGGVPLLFGLCFIFLMTTLGLGLFVSTVSKTQQQAMMTAVFFVIMPMIFLSGFVFPIENMPKLIQVCTYFLPLRYFFVVIRGLFLKGVGLAELWTETLALLGFGIVILSMSIIRFHKKLG
jgi:ABC-2 type transport system permease protein